MPLSWDGPVLVARNAHVGMGDDELRWVAVSGSGRDDYARRYSSGRSCDEDVQLGVAWRREWRMARRCTRAHLSSGVSRTRVLRSGVRMTASIVGRHYDKVPMAKIWKQVKMKRSLEARSAAAQYR